MLITSYHVSRINFIDWESSVDEDDSHFEAIAADGSDDDGEDEEGKGETADQLPLHNGSRVVLTSNWKACWNGFEQYLPGI